MLWKVLAHVTGALSSCGRGCLRYCHPMGLFLVTLTLPLTTPCSPSSHRPRGPPTPSRFPFLSGRRGHAYPDRQARESWRAGGRTPRERRLRPLTRRSLPSAPDLFLGSSGPVRWAPSYPERPYVPPTKHPGLCPSIHPVLPNSPAPFASLPTHAHARAHAGQAFSSPSARPRDSPAAELAGASAHAQNQENGGAGWPRRTRAEPGCPRPSRD